MVVSFGLAATLPSHGHESDENYGTCSSHSEWLLTSHQLARIRKNRLLQQWLPTVSSTQTMLLLPSSTSQHKQLFFKPRNTSRPQPRKP
jgi:hypothetical protein